MKVNDLAKEFGLTADAVRFYTKEGLLHPVKLTSNGYNDYREEDRHLLRFIVSARQLCFSLSDIKKMLAVAGSEKDPCPLIKRLIDSRLHQTQKRFEDMIRLRKKMSAAVEAWGRMPGCAPTGDMVRDLIDEFAAS
jgi:DNA-binding transcriptional MerR regulator